ncbi:Zinc finger and BTB domain-containing protein 22 [Nibea albiflora]|uniref:Zinc finger and BTB domain-containing protein 22 n=1 Tax=Nibea albiflora TaxID=240163 RepID=A0ACB7ESC9_NIBAL|nr:Zinc finger and BTB domain-containing protein 22 [Nibea albiflora]
MDSTCGASAAPAGLTVQVCFPGARAAVLDNLNRQREEGRLCDLSIQVQGQVFRAHRCVLAASSPYFHDQVLLKNVTTVSLPSVMDPVAFESVLSSAYTGQLSIVHDDIVNYVTVASFLQMWHIVDKCTEILKRPRPSAEVTPGEAAVAHPGTAVPPAVAKQHGLPLSGKRGTKEGEKA